MAEIRGTSGAAAALLDAARETGHEGALATLDDLERAVHDARRAALRPEDDVVAEIGAELEGADARLARAARSVEARIEELDGEHRREDARLSDARVDVVMGVVTLAFCFPMVAIPIAHCASRAARRRRLATEHRRRCDELRAAHERERERVRRLRTDPRGSARERIAAARALDARLTAVLDSAEGRGARGEVEVIERLSALPDGYVVLNDLRLEASHFLRYDGEVVRSAQVDHLVVGPTGIFVIETKAWSASFAAGGDGFDPCEQVARAGLLCHVLLKERGLPCRVRNVIARRGRLPGSPHMRRVALRAPSGLARLIRDARGRLTPGEVRAVADHLWRAYGA